MANNECLRTISDRWDQTESNVFNCIKRVAEAIVSKQNEFICWPKGDYLREVVEGFKKYGFPNVIGSIDGSHIRVTSQSFCNENYINRKGFPSVVLQSVCDHKYKFTNCYTGWPGSVQDARVYSNSQLFQSLKDDPSLLPRDTHLIGDAAYPLSRFLLVPFKDTGFLTDIQKNYNFVHSSTRCTIERAFALLKNKFPRMRQLDVSNMDNVCMQIIAICCVHNFCIDENELLGVQEEERFLKKNLKSSNRSLITWAQHTLVLN